MKIGILTFHRAHNYGAILQCYALQEILKSMNHEVWIIDYRQPYIEEVYKVFSWKILLSSNSIREFLSYLKNYFYRKKIGSRKRKNFSNFRKNHLHLTQPCTQKDIPTNMDYYIIGSDQLWSDYCTGGEKDLTYYGDFPHSTQSKIIGYAISTNLNSLNKLDSQQLKQYVQNFTVLAMREEFAANYITEKTGVPISVCADPTLLVDTNLWKSMANNSWEGKKYVLMHQARPLQGDPYFLKRKAEELANKIDLNCEVIDISNMAYTIEDFMGLFKHATYIVTTSFHATVFSLVFERPFYCIKLNDGHDARCTNLLHNVKAEHFSVNKDTPLENRPCDFTFIRKNLEQYKYSSFFFLKKYITTQ